MDSKVGASRVLALPYLQLRTSLSYSILRFAQTDGGNGRDTLLDLALVVGITMRNIDRSRSPTLITGPIP